MNAGFKAFKEKANAGGGKYLKPKDIKGSQTFRIIPWLFKKAISPILFYYEGWVEGETKKDKPHTIRFEINSDGGYDADEDITWAKGDYGLQTPKPAFAMVVADYETNSVRVLSGTQKTLIGPLSEFLDDESKLFIKDWNAYEIIITKDDKTDKFSITREKLDQEDRKYPKWIIDALEDFDFSLDDYIRCEKTEEGKGDTYKDVLNVVGDKPSRTEKQTEQPKKKKTDDADHSPSDSFEIVPDWAKIKTQGGVVLGEATEEKLKEMKGILDGKAKYDKNSVLYRAICSGILAHSKEEGDAEFEPEVGPDGFAEDDIPF